MSEQVWLAIITGLLTLVTASFGVVTTWLSLRAPRKMAELNIAANAEALRVANERADRIAAEAKKESASRSAETNRKLLGMSLLIDGVYTAAKKAELRQIEEKHVALLQAEWLSPTSDGQMKIEAAEQEMRRLREELRDREGLTKVAVDALQRTDAKTASEAAHLPGVQVHVDPDIAPADVVDVMRAPNEPDVVPMIGHKRFDKASMRDDAMGYLNPLALAPWIAAGLGLVAAGVMWWQLGRANQAIGALEQSNKQLTSALTELQNATNSRARSDDDVRGLDPNAVRDRLR